jgi:hypothetical protein
MKIILELGLKHVHKADHGWRQGCQIFLDTIYPNEGKYTKLPQHDQIAIKYTK